MKSYSAKILMVVILIFLVSMTPMSCQKKTNSLSGYVVANYTYLSSNFSGVLNKLLVNKGDLVKKNQLLFILESDTQVNQLSQAQANLVEAQVHQKQAEQDLNFQKTLFERSEKLFEAKAISHEQLEKIQNGYNAAVAASQAADAKVVSSQAALSEAQWGKNQKQVVALEDGFVFDTFYMPGELVPAGHPVVSVLVPDNIKIVLYCPEALLSQLRIGGILQIKCQGCSQQILANISYISPQAEYTQPYIYNDEHHSKLVFRIEAIPDSNSLDELHPGLPVQAVLQNQSEKE